MTDDFAAWIGRRVIRQDVTTARLTHEFRATLSPFIFNVPCPPGLHWAIAPAIPQETGPDGAEAMGLFLPPLPFHRRMWAGGEIESVAPLGVGMAVTRQSVIRDIRMRDTLCIISIQHKISAEGRLLIRERQDLAFTNDPPKPGTASPQRIAPNFVPTTPLLFRFSALTFNGHRIHYDADYAMAEGYAGPVVQGALQAALLFNLAAAERGHIPGRFTYRCLAPLIAGTPAALTMQNGEGAIQTQAGVITITASAAD
ncbi:protein dehydratase [Aestuariivirga sp.]|uniref:protein dehydratase n=1 Tax=Aestuariivirga sp. TaxID=2650926 RepID=UPI0039E40163